jgi:hypothetical protein
MQLRPKIDQMSLKQPVLALKINVTYYSQTLTHHQAFVPNLSAFHS